MEQKTKLSISQYRLLAKLGKMIYTKEGNKYLYLPFWFKENQDGTFTIISSDKLPDDLLESLKHF